METAGAGFLDTGVRGPGLRGPRCGKHGVWKTQVVESMGCGKHRVSLKTWGLSGTRGAPSPLNEKS